MPTKDSWNNGIYTMISGSIEAKFSVLPEMKIFKFDSTENSCVITDVYDNDVDSLTIPECVTGIMPGLSGIFFTGLNKMYINATNFNDIILRDPTSEVWNAKTPCDIQVFLVTM